MESENLKTSREELDIFSIAAIVWQNKLLFSSIIIIFISLGIGYLFFFNQFNTLGHQVSVNILIADNPVHEEEVIVEKMNRNLSSAYNYESWSKKNSDLISDINQNQASSLIVDAKTHTVVTDYDSEKNLESILSYLQHTAKNVSDKILDVIETEINIQERKYDLDLQMIEEEILDKRIEIGVARDQLYFIESELSKDAQSNEIIILRILDLNKIIRENEILIQSLKSRKSEGTLNFRQSEINQKLKYLNDKLVEFIDTNIDQETWGQFEYKEIVTKLDEINLGTNFLDFEIPQLREDYNSLKTEQIVSIGNKTVKFISGKEPNRLVILGISLVIGFMLGLFILLLKEEYIKRRNV